MTAATAIDLMVPQFAKSLRREVASRGNPSPSSVEVKLCPNVEAHETSIHGICPLLPTSPLRLRRRLRRTLLVVLRWTAVFQRTFSNAVALRVNG
jgi:hypothetical protein